MQRIENALSYLQNPDFASTPLEEMKDSLLQILGHELFGELGVREATDKAALTASLDQNAGIFKAQLQEARKRFQLEAKKAVERARERYRERDEGIKQALRVAKYSGLGDLGLDYLMQQIRGQMVQVEI